LNTHDEGLSESDRNQTLISQLTVPVCLCVRSSQPSVIGVVVSDVSGLCMGSSGILLPSSSGHIQSLLDVASRLSDEGEHPIIHLQGQATDVLISHTDGYTTGVARSAPFTLEAFQTQTTPTDQQQQQSQEEEEVPVPAAEPQQ
jgi:hypothetical protein